MPQSSYLQTISRRAKSHLPVLMPPRSPLSRVEIPLMPELLDELMPAQPSRPVTGSIISPQQQSPATPLREAAALLPRSPADTFNTAPSLVPSRVELPHEIKAAPVFYETSSVSSVVQPSPQQPSNLAPQPTTSVTLPLQLRDSPAQLPDPSAQIPDLAPATPAPKNRSYLQTAARILTPAPSSTFPRVSSAEVSESVVILQPPRNNSVSKSSSSKSQNFDLLSRSDLRPSRSPTAPSPANTVHIGTIDIHITPPPTQPIKPVTTTPKPVSLTPLARGFASTFGLRQG